MDIGYYFIFSYLLTLVYCQCNGSRGIINSRSGNIWSPDFKKDVEQTCTWELQFPIEKNHYVILHVTDFRLYYFHDTTFGREQYCGGSFYLVDDEYDCLSWVEQYCRVFYKSDSCEQMVDQLNNECSVGKIPQNTTLSTRYTNDGETGQIKINGAIISDNPTGFKMKYNFVDCLKDNTTTSEDQTTPPTNNQPTNQLTTTSIVVICLVPILLIIVALMFVLAIRKKRKMKTSKTKDENMTTADNKKSVTTESGAAEYVNTSTMDFPMDQNIARIQQNTRLDQEYANVITDHIYDIIEESFYEQPIIQAPAQYKTDMP